MRIAICISGVPRGGHFTTWIKKIAERYETKIFVSYWLPHDDFLVHSNTPSIRTPYILDHATYQVDKAETFYSQHLWEDMKPVFQDMVSQIKPEHLWARTDLGVASMFYMIKMVNEMRKEYETVNNYAFDVVIRSRMDTFVKVGAFDYDFSKFDIKNKIYSPDYNLAPINDHFAIMSPENADKYSSVYDNFVETANLVNHWAEKMLMHRIQGVETEMINFIGLPRFVSVAGE
jgi:hypothetical protein